MRTEAQKIINRMSVRRYAQSPKGREATRRYQAQPRVRARINKRIEWKRKAFVILKANMGGCVDCGYNGHPDALEFDHKPEFKKRTNLSRLTCHTWTVILEEIAKCDLVCANCHRIRTAKRRAA